LAAARAGGATEITHIVAVGNHGRGVKAPCGRDRQVLADSYPQIRVVIPTASGVWRSPICCRPVSTLESSTHRANGAAQLGGAG
jgi:hypothetical protein